MIKNLLGDDDVSPPAGPSEEKSPRRTREPAVIGLFGSVEETGPPPDEPYLAATRAEPFARSTSVPESYGENIRRSGMAWSIGIAFVCSVGFLLVLGWGADLLFGSSPWGVVIGIVIGSIIGFFQLFRFSSQIFKQ